MQIINQETVGSAYRCLICNRITLQQAQEAAKAQCNKKAFR